MPGRGGRTDPCVLHRHRFGEQCVRFALHVLVPAEVAHGRDGDDDDDRDDDAGFTRPRVDRLARPPGKRLDLVFLQMVPFGSFHKATVVPQLDRGADLPLSAIVRQTSISRGRIDLSKPTGWLGSCPAPPSRSCEIATDERLFSRWPGVDLCDVTSSAWSHLIRILPPHSYPQSTRPSIHGDTIRSRASRLIRNYYK